MSSSEQPVHYDTQLYGSRDFVVMQQNKEIFDFKVGLHRTKAKAKATSVQRIIIKGCLHGTIATAIFIYATNGMHGI